MIHSRCQISHAVLKSGGFRQIKQIHKSGISQKEKAKWILRELVAKEVEKR